jgi:hypothetical protein
MKAEYVSLPVYTERELLITEEITPRWKENIMIMKINDGV